MLNKKQHDRVERKTVEVHKTLRGKELTRLEGKNQIRLATDAAYTRVLFP
jgi:hypothetical protein